MPLIYLSAGPDSSQWPDVFTYGLYHWITRSLRVNYVVITFLSPETVALLRQHGPIMEIYIGLNNNSLHC